MVTLRLLRQPQLNVSLKVWMEITIENYSLYNRVIGDMKAIDWSMCAREWPHLQYLEFHKLGP